MAKHNILRSKYFLQHNHTELGGDYFDRRNVEVQRTRLIRKLEALGVKVTVEALPEAEAEAA